MKLVDLEDCQFAEAVLYELLAEREPHQSISHKEMPTLEQHCAFIESRPYLVWYLIEHEGALVGSIYLTRQREIGIGIFKACRGQGLAKMAIQELMRLHPGKFLANINPANLVSIGLFMDLGFNRVPQETYELEAP